jgi:CheY-like chemotaxis protein
MQKVLIIEDTMEMAEILQAILVHMKLTVFHETHGMKGLEVYQAEHPDLVLLDLALPDVPGWKVLDTIKELQRGEKLPAIIVITAYGDPANRLMGKLQSVHSYLIKPFSPEDVEKVVADALGMEAKS